MNGGVNAFCVPAFFAFGRDVSCECVLVVCRGFGFVTFADPDCVQDVLNAKPHVLDSKTVSVSHLILDFLFGVSSTLRNSSGRRLF